MFKKLWKKVKKSVGRHTSSGKEEVLGRGQAQPDVVNIVKAPRPPAPATASNNEMAAPTEAAKPVKWVGACPSYAAKSVVGQRMTMEDSWQAVPDLLVVPKWWTCNARDHLPPALGTAGQATSDPPAAQQEQQVESALSAPTEASASEPSPSGRTEDAALVALPATPSMSRAPLDPKQQAAMHGTEPVTVHFFAVYDGHGGPDVAKHCAKSLHEHLKTVVTASVKPDGMPVSGPLAPTAASPAGPAPSANNSEAGVAKGGGNSEAGAAAGTGNSATADPPAATEVWPARVDGIEAALKAAFLHTDAQLAQNRSAHEVGTTAVVSLVTARTLWIGNCGDSRALLCREHEAVALSLDHKATRVDEVTRVEQAGGYVWWDRVMGELAVSRAIGDHCLRPFVIAEPEITSVLRRPEDQLLIMASDGLWDVFTNEEARALALEKFNGELSRTSSSKMAVKKAASSLAKAALAKGSRDNVTVVVVDVRMHGPSAVSHSAAAATRGSTGSATPTPRTDHGTSDSAPVPATVAAAAAASPPSASGPAPSVQQQPTAASPATPGGSDMED